MASTEAAGRLAYKVTSVLGSELGESPDTDVFYVGEDLNEGFEQVANDTDGDTDATHHEPAVPLPPAVRRVYV